MGVVNYTVPAERDLIDIWLYIAEDNMEAADTLIDQFIRCASNLPVPLRWEGSDPNLGIECGVSEQPHTR